MILIWFSQMIKWLKFLNLSCKVLLTSGVFVVWDLECSKLSSTKYSLSNSLVFLCEWVMHYTKSTLYID